MSPARARSASASIHFRERTISPTHGDSQLERRQHLRYPITVNAQYRLANHIEPTTTLDISSHGILLKTDTILVVGAPIEVSIDWPALLEQRCPLRLIIRGRILRSNEKGTAVAISTYDLSSASDYGGISKS